MPSRKRVLFRAASFIALVLGASALPVLLPATQAIAESVAGNPPIVALSGRNSRIVKPGFRRITTAKEWEALWKQHTGKSVVEFGDQSGMPRVNFKDCMVIAIFSGSSLANDGVSATAVTETPEKITLHYSNRYFQIGMPNAKQKAEAAKNGAFGLFIVPRSVKPVVLEEAVVNRMGQPPVPTVRAELP